MKKPTRVPIKPLRDFLRRERRAAYSVGRTARASALSNVITALNELESSGKITFDSPTPRYRFNPTTHLWELI